MLLFTFTRRRPRSDPLHAAWVPWAWWLPGDIAALRADVASGALHTVILVPSRDPRVDWVVGHCQLVPTKVLLVCTYYCGTPTVHSNG